jgi:AcrR family transcriptional regulator
LTRYKSGQQSKDNIYATAKRLFYENGFINTTLMDIARESGANKAMVSYYFENKNKLALEIYNEYMVAVKVRTQNAINVICPKCNHVLRTALEYRIQNRNCRANRHLNRFYHELCESNVFLQNESASVGFVENLNRAYKLGLSRLDAKAIALANLATVHALHVARNEGFLECSSEYVAETEIRLLVQSLRCENDFIDECLKESERLLDQIELTVGENFAVK